MIVTNFSTVVGREKINKKAFTSIRLEIYTVKLKNYTNTKKNQVKILTVVVVLKNGNCVEW